MTRTFSLRHPGCAFDTDQWQASCIPEEGE